MTTSEKKVKKEKVFQETLAELSSSEEVLVKKAIKKIQKKGNEKYIKPMLEFIMTEEHEEFLPDVSEMLSSLKVSAAEDELISALEEERFKSIQSNILSYIWNSGFEPVEHMQTICAVAVRGDYLTALEALTVIENTEGPYNEDQILESLFEIRTYLSENPESEIRDLIASIQGLLIQYEQLLD